MAAGHVAQLGGYVHDLVGGQQAEVDRHELDDGSQATEGGSDARADEDRFRDGRVLNAVLAELVDEALGDAVGAAVEADVLAHQEDALVVEERFAQCLPYGVPVG